MRSSVTIGFSSLPDTLPIYILEKALLLPGGQLPLNILEPTSTDMVNDALATQSRLIGLLLRKDKAGKTFYDTGCAGRITSFEEMVDGRMVIVLTGLCRFDVVQELPNLRKYKRFNVSWDKYRDDLVVDLNPEIDREKLISLLKEYVNRLSIEMDWEVVSHTPSYNLVTFFSMNLPFETDERQALLSAQTMEEKAELLISLIELSSSLLGRRG